MSFVTRVIHEHARRFTRFGIIGALVFLLGEAILLLGVWLGMSTGWAFLLQSYVSILVSFALNWKRVFREDESFWGSLSAPFRRHISITERWRALRRSDAWMCFWRFNVSRIGFIVVDQAVFMALVRLGMQYLVANVVDTAVFTPVNYLISWLWVFYKSKKKKDNRLTAERSYAPKHAERHWAAVVVPVKGSQRTLRACVASLLAQDHPVGEIILVGDRSDTSWSAVTDFIREGRITVLEAAVNSPGRDANAKRAIGLRYAAEQGYSVLVLTDSDMVLPTSWLHQGLTLIGLGWECVAGPLVSVATGFWPTYVDRNPVLPKTPRMANDYVLDAHNFGRKKPPITANVFFRATAYARTGEFDPNFVNDYEDYEFFARMVSKGTGILCTHLLEAGHNHREGFRALSKDYMVSGRGCADFVAFRQESAMAKQRLREVRLVQAASVLGPVIIAGLLASFALPTIATATVIYGLLASYCAVRARTPMGFVFPFVTGVFLAAFLWGFIRERACNKQQKVKTTVEAVTPLRIS